MPYFGVCYSPYHRTNAPPPYNVSADEVDADMAIIRSKGFTHIRTYSAASGNVHNVARAGKYGLKVGLGVWIENNVPNNALIDQALSQALDDTYAHPGANTVVDLVIGNEVNRTDDKSPLDPMVILNYIKYAKQQLQTNQYAAIRNIRVTSCFSGTVLQDPNSPSGAIWSNLIDNCDSVVYLTVYPWYAKKNEGAPPPDNITNNMNWSWDNGLKQVVARGKSIVIAEIGWPSAGGGDADHSPTTPENERINYQTTKRFLSGATAPHWALDTFWFEMFDEPWKTKEGSWGPHWGLYSSGPNPSPKFNF